jgi:cell division protein FtsW (lipid II flippase)
MNFLFTHIEPWIWLTVLFSFLVAYAVSTVVIINKKKKTTSARQLTTLYMVLKAVRLLVFIGIVFAYLLIVKIEAKRFALVAIALYLVYLLLDTLFLAFTEKRLKKK